MLYSNRPLVKKPAPLTIRSSCLKSVSTAEHHSAEQAVLQNGKDKTLKPCPEEQSLMNYSPKLSEDTKSLRSRFGNSAKMLLKSHLGIKCYSQYIKSSESFSTVPPIVNGGGTSWGCIVRDLAGDLQTDIHSSTTVFFTMLQWI